MTDIEQALCREIAMQLESNPGSFPPWNTTLTVNGQPVTDWTEFNLWLGEVRTVTVGANIKLRFERHGLLFEADRDGVRIVENAE